jgi:hypothetical protein
MGWFEELELERSIHLQIIEDLKAQLQLQQVAHCFIPALLV